MNVKEVEEAYYFQDEMSVDGMMIPGEGFLWDKEVEDAAPAEQAPKPLSSWKGGGLKVALAFRALSRLRLFISIP